MNRYLQGAASGALLLLLTAGPTWAACCYFAAKNKDVLQPAQKAFITWDPELKIESFIVQPKFQGNAENFGMVVPTPGRPTLAEAPRDFFKAIAVFTILKQRKFPESKIVWMGAGRRAAPGAGPGRSFGGGQRLRRRSTVTVLEAGIVGTLDYKIITAERADDLYTWLKENHYHYAGDEETLDYYVKKGWYFTVMRIDPEQMKERPDGKYEGDVSPTRFRFSSQQLVYPLRITQISVRDKTEALLYIQAPYKVDLPGDMTYQYQWVPMLQNAKGWYKKGIFGEEILPGGGDNWLGSIEPHVADLVRRGNELGFTFRSGARPVANSQGRIATTLEWARRITPEDILLLHGDAPYSDTVPDVDEGFDREELSRDPQLMEQARKVIMARINRYLEERPGGYLVREAPKEDIENLKILADYLREGQFITKIRKTFTVGEMNEDLLIVPAGLGGEHDSSEYVEVLPTSPP